MNKDTKYFVYLNKHKSTKENKVWSLKNVKTNIVEEHASFVYIKKPKLVVSQKGRKRTLDKKKKFVHAGVIGKPADCGLIDPNWTPIRYNPTETETFVTFTGEPVNTADWVMFTPVGVYAYNPRNDETE